MIAIIYNLDLMNVNYDNDVLAVRRLTNDGVFPRRFLWVFHS